jgi:plasmid stabilization system protein ParE
MSLPIHVLPAARDDIAAAAAWYESRRPGLGSAFLTRIDELLRRVSEQPFQFPEVHATVRRGLTRRFPYAVYFSLAESRADVLAVIHLHRHPESWKRGR